MQVFVVSYKVSEDEEWHLETVASSPLKADKEREELFAAGALFVRYEELKLDGKSSDSIIVFIYDATEDPIVVIKH